MLYPNRELPRFVDRNNIPPAEIQRSALLKKLVAEGERSLVERDLQGRCHFSGSLANGREVGRVLQALAGAGYASLVKRESARVLGLYERLFDQPLRIKLSGPRVGSATWDPLCGLMLN